MRKQILSYLEKNSKMDSKEIAILLGTEPDVVENEIRKMEEEKIICGYHTMIDWDKTSMEKVTAIIEVRVTPQRGEGFDKIAESIYNYPEVSTVSLISGAYDLLVTLGEAVCPAGTMETAQVTALRQEKALFSLPSARYVPEEVAP